MSERKHFYFGREQGWQLIERECSIVPNRNEPKPGPDSIGQELPGNEITVVLHLSEQNHITRSYVFSAPCLRDEIDAFSRAAGEHNLISAGGADVVGYALP